MAMLGLQRFPLKLNQIKNAEDTIVLRSRKMFNSYNFSIASCYYRLDIFDRKSKFRLKDLLQF